MYSFITYALLASATLINAFELRWEFPESVPALQRRQEPGTPAYQCHEDCGLLITLGRTEGYCDNSEWNERYGRCMICANTQDIWQYYGQSVTSLAEDCGLSPTPSPSGWEASSTTSPETTVAPIETTAVAETSAAAEKTTTAPTPGTISAVSTVPVETENSAPGTDAASTTVSVVPTTLSTTSAVTGSAAPSESATGSSATRTTIGTIGTIGVIPTATPSTVIVSGAAKNGFFAGAFCVVVLAMVNFM